MKSEHFNSSNMGAYDQSVLPDPDLRDKVKNALSIASAQPANNQQNQYGIAGAKPKFKSNFGSQQNTISNTNKGNTESIDVKESMNNLPQTISP